jgi:hypothetical protein
MTGIAEQRILSAAPAERGWTFEQTVGAARNPLGFESTSSVYYTVPLGMGGGELWESSNVEFGAENSFTPADNRLLAYFSIEPIAIFNFSAHAGYYQAYKALDNGFVARSSYHDSFSGSGFDNARQENKNGLWADASPEFRIRLGDVIFTHELTLNYIRIRNNRSGYFYEPHEDAVMRNTDYSIYNTSHLLYALNDNFMLGGTHFIMNVPRSGYVCETVTAIEVFTVEFQGGKEFHVALQEGTHLRNRYFRHAFYCAGEAGFSVRL